MSPLRRATGSTPRSCGALCFKSSRSLEVGGSFLLLSGLLALFLLRISKRGCDLSMLRLAVCDRDVGDGSN